MIYAEKAVNWALRQIGIAIEIQSNSAKWIASDALRELTGEKIQRWLR